MANDAGEASVKDSFDEVLRRAVTGDSTPELKPGALLADRFTIEKMVGAGGMGAVYVARDQTLGRDVAIKLHHTPGGAFRLRREAMAMARLAHPNVVTVFEVGELGRFPFVVMEYVPGTTLRAWLAAEPRSVEDILDMLCAAGEGLAAAHDAGLIHRDVKPENVLVGSDGRARVGDFGLARELDSQDDLPPPSGSTPSLLAPMTQTGAVLGTPAYMAPEQLAGVTIDSRADQFAFCVTVWEALWGQRPYPGANLEELVRAVTSGTRRPPPSTPKVPPRIRLALERGLAADPTARFPSMRALLDALHLPARRRRKRYIVAGALGMVALGVAGYLVFGRGNAEAACESAGEPELARLPTEIGVRVRALGDVDSARRIEFGLDKFTAFVKSSAQRACVATARREWSPQLLSKSYACLDVAVRTVRDMLRPPRLLPEDVAGLVVRATTGLPAINGCTSASFLAASSPLPDDPAALEAVIDARSQTELAIIAVQAHANARPYLERLERSPIRDSPLVRPALLVAQGAEAANHGNNALGEKLAGDGYYAARAVDDDSQLVMALSILLMFANDKPPGDPMVATWLRITTADADRIATRLPAAAAGLFLSAATVADRNDDGPAALRFVERARALEPTDEALLSRGWMVEGNVLMWSGHVPEGIAAFERSIASEIKRLGPNHPAVGAVLTDYSVSLLDAERTKEAFEVARRALAILDKSPDANDQSADSARVNLAAVLLMNDDNAAAQQLLETARTHYVAHQGVKSSVVANVDMNLAIIHLDAHDTTKAIAMLEEALATDEAVLGPERLETAEVLYNLAAAHRDAKDLERAQAYADRCAAIYAKIRPGVDHHVLALDLVAHIANLRADHAKALTVTAIVLGFAPQEEMQSLAWARLERAKALIGLRRPGEARPLLTAARTGYEAARLTERVQEIDRLLAQTR